MAGVLLRQGLEHIFVLNSKFSFENRGIKILFPRMKWTCHQSVKLVKGRTLGCHSFTPAYIPSTHELYMLINCCLFSSW